MVTIVHEFLSFVRSFFATENPINEIHKLITAIFFFSLALFFSSIRYCDAKTRVVNWKRYVQYLGEEKMHTFFPASRKMVKSSLKKKDLHNMKNQLFFHPSQSIESLFYLFLKCYVRTFIQSASAFIIERYVNVIALCVTALKLFCSHLIHKTKNEIN